MAIGKSNKAVTWQINQNEKTIQIFLISVLGLFLELMFIRWISTEIRIFAYLQNTILVVCFLGLGLGCFTCRHPIKLRQILLPMLLLTLIFAIPFVRQKLCEITTGLSVLDDFVIWNYAIVKTKWQKIIYIILSLLIMYFLMVLIVDIFVPIGRILGRLMEDHPNTIWAYSVNVGGSLIGIWIFVFISMLYQPPITWFIIFGGLIAYFLNKTDENWKANLALLFIIILLSLPAGKSFTDLKTVWSPYQKLTLRKADNKKEIGEYIVNVNNTGYQVILDLRESNIPQKKHKFNSEMFGLSQYDIPLLLHPNPEKYLIVGSGTGNDVAGGLRHQVDEIVAVEIDPAIISMGRHYHPERPYSSSNVKVINDDARSFFATCKEKFDIITFGLLDSHTTTAMTNARLDHYVYTKESILHAKSLLYDGGIFVLSFEAAKPFIADRMAKILRETFDHDPISFRIPITAYGWGGVIFISGDLDIVKKQISKNERLASLIEKFQKDYPLNFSYKTKITTDDWPYIYLNKPNIPIIFYLLSALLFILLFRSYNHWNAAGLISRLNKSHYHFFFLGAAFLLLEVQNISKASVVLGSTWQVNAVIITGVLSMILLANFIAYKFPKIPIKFLYLLLIASCLGLFLIDLSRFAFLAYPTKALTIGILTTLPMLFSGIIFIRSFAIINGKDEALGANLIGALVGALLQSITFITGIKFLLLIVAGLYFFSYLTKPQETSIKVLT
jgi:spermidine synthase